MRRFKGCQFSPPLAGIVQMVAGQQHGLIRERSFGNEPPCRDRSWSEFDHAAEDLWVFGYGSLIWRPGFEYVERVPAHIIGMHRSLCVYSFDHRGTPERPGLVLGLDFGGACRGIAYRVAAKHRAATLAYLRDREQTTAVYREMVRGVWLEGPPERRVEALCYVVDRGHPQYAGRLTPTGNCTSCARATADPATTATT